LLIGLSDMAESTLKNMNNQHIIKIGETFLKEYLTKIGELESDKTISDKEAFIARTLGKNAINIWSGLFSDKRSPFFATKLPTITEAGFGGMMKAFAYFTFVELDEIFHIYNSPFQDNSVKGLLAPLLADVSKGKITEIVSTAIGGEDISKYFVECEKIIVGNREDAKNPEEEISKKYLFGVQIMFDDSEGNITKDVNPKSKKDVEEFALTIYKNNMASFFSSSGEGEVESKKLSSEEQEHLKNWMAQMEEGEIAQVQDLIDNCNITFQFAKNHSVYLKDWEKTKERMENNLKNGILPPGVSANLHRAIIDATDKVIQRKLKRVRDAFEKKFGESIYNYLGSDGKTKKLFGIFG